LLPLAVLTGSVAVARAYDTTWVAPGAALSAAKLKADFDEIQMRLAALEGQSANSVPSGAVMAFNLSACPTGWTGLALFGGRTIIGVNTAGGNGLSQRNLGDTAGEEHHTMVVAEMPSHTHTISLYGTGSGPNQGAWNFNWVDANDSVYGSQSAMPPLLGAGVQNFMANQPSGGGAPFNNMQPSVAMLYCVKN
jgi:microcystin-dependent protein